MYAYDPKERPRAGRREREWLAVADSELGVVREMAAALRLSERAACRSEPDQSVRQHRRLHAPKSKPPGVGGHRAAEEDGAEAG